MFEFSDMYEATEKIRFGKTLIVSHIDADGITSAAILAETLERSGIDYNFMNIKQLTSITEGDVLSKARNFGAKHIIFSDLGSGQLNIVKNIVDKIRLDTVIILDHHRLRTDNDTLEREIRNKVNFYHFNAFKLGWDGGNEVSGSGLSFIFSMHMNEHNSDLVSLAMVGAVGDMQNYKFGRLIGVNEQLLNFGEGAGYLRSRMDIPFFGIETRPLHVMLMYAQPYIPGITGDKDKCIEFFDSIGIRQKQNGEWRTWTDLSKEEQMIIKRRLNDVYSVFNRRPLKEVQVIELLNWIEKTETRYAKEFSTLLNATGRNDKADIGVDICLRRPRALQKGLYLLKQHRSNLAKAISILQDNERIKNWTYFYLADLHGIKDSIIGIVTGMAIGSRIIKTDKPVFAVAETDNDYYKISGRVGGEASKKRYNLKEILTDVSKKLNNTVGDNISEAGGHEMAAGAYVKKEYLNDFVYFLYERMQQCSG